MKRISLTAGLVIALAGAIAWAGKNNDPAKAKSPEAAGAVVLAPDDSKTKPEEPAKADAMPPVAAGPQAPAVLEIKAPAVPEEVKPAGTAPAALPTLATPEDKTHTMPLSVKDIVVDPSAGQTNDNPTGRQEPAVSVEWIGPPSAKVGQSVTYQLVVKNVCASPVYQAVLHVRVPSGTTVSATEPKAVDEDEMLMWALGTMEPRQEKRIDLQVVPGDTGSVSCHAFVTFTGISTARLEVHRPKVAVKASAPKNVIAGDPATILLTVSNPGDAMAESVKVKATLSDGLEHAHGKVIEFDLGNLTPGDSRNVFVLCGAKTAGEQKCEAVVTADPKLEADETVTIDVLKPQVALTVSGPGMRYLDRHAVFTFKVTNPGTATATHVNVIDEVPLGFKFVSATANGRHDFVNRTVTWFLGDIGPEKTKEVTLELVAVNPGEHKNKATATAARGLRCEGEVATRIEGLPALLMELVDLDDPLEVGAETSYEIRVTNTGTKTETNLQLTCTVPEKMEFRGAKGAAGCNFKQDGRDVIFDPLPRLAPRADAIYRVKVRGVSPGDLRFQARMKADGLTVPVLKEESTKVYGDEVETHDGAGKEP
jgi:uncharacterized repeat protein (TIGR01451 family)